MDIHRLALRRALVSWLYTACPGLVQAMKETRQVHPATPSVFHMEDSVWTHDMLVLHTALDQQDFSLEDILTALVHDFAKPLTACVRPARKGPGWRISFAGHGPLGTQAAADCCCALRRALSLPVSNSAIARIAAATSGHIAFYNIPDASAALTFCNNDPRLLRTMTRLLSCDMQGSIADTTCEGFTGNLALLQASTDVLRTAVFPKETEHEAFALTAGRGVHLVCGLPSPARDRLAADLARGRKLLFVQPAGTGPAKDRRYLPCPLPEEVSGKHCADSAALAQNQRTFLAALRQCAAQAEAGVFLCGDVATYTARNALYALIGTALPGCPITCTYVLTPSAWFPAMPADLEKGLPSGQRKQHVPSLFREPALAGAAIEIAARQGL